MPRPEAPCKNCSDRDFGCHERCETYQKFKKERFNYNLQVAKSKGYNVFFQNENGTDSEPNRNGKHRKNSE